MQSGIWNASNINHDRRKYTVEPKHNIFIEKTYIPG